MEEEEAHQESICRIKLKLPRIAVQEDRLSRKKSHACNKDFSSGKSLTRIHARAATAGCGDRVVVPNKKLLKKRVANGDGIVGGGAIADGEPTCSLCGRQFSSIKSLFGHMRCHPERPWRGINPPPSSPSLDSAPTSTRSSVVHLAQSLSGWSVTGKRGRKPTSGSVGASISVSGGPLAEEQIVHDLLMLAQASPIDEGSSGTNKEEIEDNNWDLPVAFVGNSWSKKLKVMGKEETEQVDHQEEEPKELNLSFNFNCEKRRKIMKRRRKKKRLRDLEIGENKYMCSMCNKTFRSHQALGGHKSSHNKHNNNITPSPLMAHHHIHSVSQNATKPQLMDMEEEEGQHQCKVCGMTFSSGQALGGHMRSHWTGAHQQAQPPSSQVTSAGEASRTGQKILGFDLNYPPPMDQEDEGIDSGFFNPNMNVELMHILG